MIKNKNILELCLADGLGGLEMFTSTCYDYFKKNTKCKVVVEPKYKLASHIKSDDVLYLPRNNKFPIFPALKLAKIINKYDIEIIHIHWIKDLITAILAKKISKKKPMIVYSRHMEMTRFKNDFYHKWLYKNIDMIHAVTLQVKEQLEKFIPQEVRPKIKKIYLGVNEPIVDENKIIELKKQYNLKDEFVVGIIGRIEEAKGQYIVIEALAKLKDLNIKVLIVGQTMDLDYLESLKQKIKELHIEDKVIFTGFTRNVNEHIKLCNVTVLATPKETFGLVVIESMVNKVPVIAVSNGGPLEIIDDMKDGLFFDRSVDDLILKIQLLYKDADLKQKIGLAAYQKIKTTFNQDIQMQNLYKTIIEG